MSKRTGNKDNDERRPLLAHEEGFRQAESSVPWYKTDIFILYCDSALSGWGDRMWSFAVSMFLTNLTQSLQLTAIYGFTSGISAIVCGAAIGKWIDHTSRLRAARTALILQNFFVATSAVLLCVIFIFLNSITGVWMGIAQGCVILLAVLADLSSLATNLTVSKDWLPVIAKDSYQLSCMNAMVRRIDLTTQILAPLVTGQLMTYSGGLIDIENSENVVTAICMAGWNMISVVLEYRLVTLIYRGTPELAFRKPSPTVEVSSSTIKQLFKESEANHGKEAKASTDLSLSNEMNSQKKKLEEANTLCRCGCFKCITNVTSKLKNYAESWKIYFRQDVLAAGIGLCLLYMTVLSFDSVALGFAKLQGLSESTLGILSGVGALIGIVGTLVYPLALSRFGVERTGMYGFFSEFVCLSACVASVWLPGSPFEPEALFQYTEDIPINSTESSNTKPKLSIILLMAGMVTARFGLWTADLAVNQIMQERIEESCRGTVFGAQSSINNAMSTLKYTLVIILPSSKTFGYLIILSFLAVCLGWIAFCIYSCKQQRHFSSPSELCGQKCAETTPSELPPKILVS